MPFDVYVNDGVVEGATVWVDMNDNGRIDEGDINLGKTDQNGRLADVSGEHAGKRIIVDLRGARDLFTGERFSLTQELYYTAMSDERGGSDVVASPISTILEALRSLDGNEDATDEELLAKIFEDTGVTVELDDLNNVDNFIHPAREQDQTFPTGSINALRDAIATTSIRLQLLLEQKNGDADLAADDVDEDGFDPTRDLTMENQQEAQTRIAEAIQRAGGEPVANPNPNNLPLTTPEDTELTLPMDVWGFRDPTGNTPGTNQPESSFTELRIVSITTEPPGTDTGALVDADGTEYRAGNTVPADKISGLKYRPPTHFFGEVRIEFRVYDGQVQSDPTTTLTLTVTSVNDVPTDIVLSGDRDAAADRELYVLNNGRIVATDGTVAGLLTAADVETNAGVASGAQTGLTYRLGGTHGNLFEIVSVGGDSRLQLKGDVTALNPGQIYTLTITVTDANGGSYTETFNIVQGGLYVTPQGVTQTDGTERVYSDSPTGLVNEEASGATNPIQVGSISLEGLPSAADIRNLRYTLVSGEGDDDNDDFTLNIGTGALSYTGSDSGDYEAGGANHQPDDLSIRVRVDYYAVAQQAARFAGERFVDATGDRTDTDTREFAYSGGTIRMPSNAYATVTNTGIANVRIVSKIAGPTGNNIEIRLVYDASRATGPNIVVSGEGTTDLPYIITIYTTLTGLSPTALQQMIAGHTATGDDTRSANELVSVDITGSPTTQVWDPSVRTDNTETFSLTGAAEAPYHVAAGTIHFGDETYTFPEAYVSRIAGSDTIIIVALGDHDDDDATDDTWQVQAVATLPEGNRFFVLGTIGDDDVRISGGALQLDGFLLAGASHILPGGTLAMRFWAKAAGDAGNFIEVNVVYNAGRVAGADNTRKGVVDLTVTGDGTSASKYIITVYTTAVGATAQQIKSAIERNAQANEIVVVRVVEGQNPTLDPDEELDNSIEFVFGGGDSNGGAYYQIAAGTIFDGDRVIHFARTLLAAPAASESGRNKLILRRGDHDNDDATPDTWQVELVATLPADRTTYYLLADTPLPPNAPFPRTTLSLPYTDIENTDIQIATQNLGTALKYTQNADASGNLRDDDARTFSYSGGVITQTDSGTQDEVNVRVAAGTLYLSGGVVINFDALPTTLVTEHSYVIVDDVNGDGRYTLRIVTKLPSSSTPANDKYYVLGSISPNGERLEGGVLEVSPTGFGRHTESAGGNLLHVLSAKAAGTDNALVTLSIVYDSAAPGATSTDPGVISVTVTRPSGRYIITVRVTDGGATREQIKTALEAHTQAGTDIATANDLINMFVTEAGRTTIIDPSAVTGGSTEVEIPLGAATNTPFTVAAGTIYDGANVISFAARTFTQTSATENIIIVREGDHDSNPSTPDTWQVELVSTLPATGNYYVLYSNLQSELTFVRELSSTTAYKVHPTIRSGVQNLGADYAGPLSQGRFVVGEEREFVLNLKNVNDNEPVFTSTPPSTPIPVPENTGRDEVGLIFTAQASDADDTGGPSSIRYTLAVVDNFGTVRTGLFEINAQTGEIRLATGSTLDKEATGTGGPITHYVLTITATSTLTGATTVTQTATQEVRVEVTNVNEAPTAIAIDRAAFNPADARVNEGLQVGTLSTTDVDTTTFAYTISGADSALFEIRNGNELWFIGTTSDLRGPGEAYQIRITTTETGTTPSLTFSQDFTIIQGGLFLGNGRQVVDDEGRPVLVIGQGIDAQGEFV
ncbi:MAG: cadherin repeat domain-containing protein, partial [Alphaproteobacteria bacterium]|nr:cadherin repeat domain-containing protein [Alphaproteobacteria bacterium]